MRIIGTKAWEGITEIPGERIISGEIEIICPGLIGGTAGKMHCNCCEEVRLRLWTIICVHIAMNSIIIIYY